MEEELLLAGASNNVEYQVTVPRNSEQYMKTVVAFANGQGGTIVFGVDDSLRVVGMEADTIFQTMDAITNAISDSCEPRIVPSLTLQTIEGNTVIVVEIESGRQRPYFLKSKGIVDGTYTRVGATIRVVADYMLRELILEGQNRYFDSEIHEGLHITDEDIQLLCTMLKDVALKNASRPDSFDSKDVTAHVLLSWGVLAEREKALVPTNAYALLTGHASYRPVVQCAVFKGTTRAYFVDRREFAGPIQDQVESAFQYVREKINLGMRLQGILRQDVYELPMDSVREVIANAIAHRSYLVPGNVQVALYDDRLEVTSPGMLVSGVSIEKMKAGYSKIRNRAIANAFAYMRIIKQWGSGIPRVIRECKEYGLPEPEFIDFGTDLRVNIYRSRPGFNEVSSVNDRERPYGVPAFTDDDRALLTLLHGHPRFTQQEIASALNWTVGQVKYYQTKLKKRQSIKRVGTSQKGYWEVLVPLHNL